MNKITLHRPLAATASLLAGVLGLALSSALSAQIPVLPLPSNNANLSSLALSSGTLNPAFVSGSSTVSGSSSYTATTQNNSLTVTPTLSDTTATVTVDGTAVSSGSASGLISLASGSNTITIVGTAQDGLTTQTYTVVVTRAPLTWTYNSVTDIPDDGFTYAASGTATLALNFAPPAGTTLTVVNNTGPAFISGSFSNLAQGQTVSLGYNGLIYQFVVNYYGGKGRDVVLQWANVRPVAWGLGNAGQLGVLFNQSNSSIPLQVDTSSADGSALAGKTILSLAAGYEHSLALCSDGSIVAWGGGITGALGGNTTPAVGTPQAVDASGSDGSAIAGKLVVAIAASQYDSFALCSDGSIAAWGENSDGQLGNSGTNNSSLPVAVDTSVADGSALAGKIVTAISAGNNHCLALCSDGTVVAWGDNSAGELGNNSAEASSSVPVAVDTSAADDSALAGKTVVAISAGSYFSMALCSDGTVVTWGDNTEGELGDNGAPVQINAVPVAVDIQAGDGSALAGKVVTAISAGGDRFALALCSDGTLVAWGYDYYGDLGIDSSGQNKGVSVPVAVDTSAGDDSALAGKVVSSISTGIDPVVLCSDGTLASWGRNLDGFLGDNSTSQSSVPVAVDSSGLATGEHFCGICVDSNRLHNLALVGSPEPPTLSPISITSNNANPSYAKAGDVITLSFTADESIETPTVLISGSTATVTNAGGNSWTATIVPNTSTNQGPATFSIAFSAIDGTPGVTGTATTDSSSVTVLTAPIVLNFSEVPTTGYYANRYMPDLKGDLEDLLPDDVVVTQSPLPGSLLTTGTVNLDFTGTDPAGNYAEKSMNITVLPFDIVGTVGAPLPRYGNSTFASFGTPSTGAYAAVIRSNSVNSAALLRPYNPFIYNDTGRIIQQVGDYMDGTTITGLSDPSGDAYLATLKTSGTTVTTHNNTLLMWFNRYGAYLAARTGTPASGLPAGVTIKDFLKFDGNGSSIFFLANLQGTGITLSNEMALCSAANNQIRVVAQQGEGVTVDGSNRVLSVIGTFMSSAATAAEGRWRAGNSAFGMRATFTDKSQALFTVPAAASSSAAWSLLAETGTESSGPLAGAVNPTFGVPAFSGTTFATLLNLTPGKGGITATDNVALVGGTFGGSPMLLAQTGKPAPNASGSPLAGVTFKTLDDPIAGGTGSIAFKGTLSGSGVTLANNTGMWYSAEGDALTLLARTGSAAPGANGALWSKFQTIALPDDPLRGPIFLATLSGPGVTLANNLGLWAVNSSGSLELILRTGQKYLGKTIKSFTALVPLTDSVGTASGYDNDGNVAAYVTYTDGTKESIVVTVQ